MLLIALCLQASVPELRYYYFSADSTFGSGGSTTGKAVRTTFKFGFPLAGYSTVEDRTEEQLLKLEDFIWDDLVNGGVNLQKKFDDAGELKFFHNGYGCMERYISAVLAVPASSSLCGHAPA